GAGQEAGRIRGSCEADRGERLRVVVLAPWQGARAEQTLVVQGAQEGPALGPRRRCRRHVPAARLAAPRARLRGDVRPAHLPDGLDGLPALPAEEGGRPAAAGGQDPLTPTLDSAGMPIAVSRVVLSQYGANCYVLRASEDAAQAVVVNPGGDPSPLLEGFRGTVAAILVTHTDIDHIEGVADLQRATGAAVWAPAGEAENLVDGVTRTGGSVAAYAPEHLVADGDVVRSAGLELQVTGIPGHSPDHVAYSVDGSIFSGDL